MTEIDNPELGDASLHVPPWDGAIRTAAFDGCRPGCLVAWRVVAKSKAAASVLEAAETA